MPLTRLRRTRGTRMKTPIDKLDKAIVGILNEYSDDIKSNVSDIVKRLAKSGASAVNNSAKKVIRGKKYTRSWTSEVQETRFGTFGVIYSKKAGLAHLLEHGHALRSGGRTAAREHIKPVEEDLVKKFEKEIVQKL